MASVSSLDQDMRNLRMGRYTQQAASEIRIWIEEVLGEPLPSGDLLNSLKDGVVLCKLANLVLPPPGIKFKQSSMPFIQMENISHFLKACEMPPLSMPAHDRFLTVDLYEGKDPAQVLQCLSAFARQAHATRPDVVRSAIGPKKSGVLPSAWTGSNTTNGSAAWRQSGTFRAPSPNKPSSALPGAARAMSPALTGGSTGSQTTDGGSSKTSSVAVSSWSKRGDEGTTAPAWNIHQYGYMGGASQGNQGVSFGARRQITSQAPSVPSLADKEKARREKATEEERSRREAEELDQRKRLESEAEEERTKAEEERRWLEQTRKAREEERQRVEEQKRQWAEQERKWKEEEARREQEAELNHARISPKKPPEKPRVPSSGILRGQTLSQYQKEHATLVNKTDGPADSHETPEQARVRELEKQLEEARERERQYQAEREERLRQGSDRSRPSTARTENPRPQSAKESEASWAGDERGYLRQQWQSSSTATTSANEASADTASQALPEPEAEPPFISRPLPEFTETTRAPDDSPALPQRMQPSVSSSSIYSSAPGSSPLGSANRPLPTPDKEFEPFTPSPSQQPPNRTGRFLATNPAPSNPLPRVSSSQEAGDTALEQSSLRDAREASQNTTKAGGWASKSLLEREMERERDRQREWESNQEKLKMTPRDTSQGSGEGQTWDVNQYGYTGGDGMNRGSSAGSGINIGGRRQVLGPREMGSGRR